MRDSAQVLEQVAVEMEVRAQHLGNAQGKMAVRDRKQDGFGEQGAEELDLLLVAGRTEPSSFAGERQQVFVFAVIAAHAGKPVLQVAAVQKLIHDFRDDRAQEAIAGLVTLLVSVQEGIEISRQALPQWRCLGLPGTIDLLLHARQCIQMGVSSNGIPPKKVLRK